MTLSRLPEMLQFISFLLFINYDLDFFFSGLVASRVYFLFTYRKYLVGYAIRP